MSTPIALLTTAIPRTYPQPVIAIINLSAERACELLEIMDEITKKATYSSKAFKVSSFEPNALYVPYSSIQEHPAPGNFLVLKEDFVVTDITPVKVIHADVMPNFVSWEAYDIEERFKLTTAALDSHLLNAIARGLILPPHSTSETIRNNPSNQRPQAFFNFLKHWPTIQ